MTRTVCLGRVGKPKSLLNPRFSASVSGQSVRNLKQRNSRGRTPNDADGLFGSGGETQALAVSASLGG